MLRTSNVAVLWSCVMMVLLMLAMLGCGLGDQPHSKTPHDVPAFFHSTVEVLAATKNLTRSPISPFARPDSFWMHPLPLVFPNSVVSKCPRISSHSRIVSTRCAALHLRRNEAGYLEQVRAERLSSQDRELMYPPGSRLTPKELCIPVLQWRLARTRMEAFDREPLRVMLLFGEHGRELVSSELALRFLGILSDLAVCFHTSTYSARTHSLTHSHSQLTHTSAHIFIHTLALTHSHSHTHIFTHAHTLPHSHTHTHTHSLIPTYTHTPALFFFSYDTEILQVKEWYSQQILVGECGLDS